MKRSLAVFLTVFALSTPDLPAATSADSIRDSLGEFFQIYLTVPKRRHAKERVIVKGDEKTGYSAEIWYWRSLAQRDPAEEICSAYRWLFFGRGKYGQGASDAFKKYAGLTEIQLKFFDVETGTKLGKNKGEVLPTERVVPYLRLGVTKNSLQNRKADWGVLKSKMAGGGAKCREVAGPFVDDQWFDDGYLKRGR